jgi:hypothetical protein
MYRFRSARSAKATSTEEVRFVVKTKTFEKERRQSNKVSNVLKARMASDGSAAPPRALRDPARLSTSSTKTHTKDCGKS